MAHSKVPKFGAWESGENVAYTAFFETARKGKAGGPITNPNEMLMNQDMETPAKPANPPPATSKPARKQPKFGDWNEGEEVPYTAYFENSRKDKTNAVRGEPQLNRDMATPTTNPPLTTSKPAPKQPKFGDWNEGEEVPYTAYFENTRKAKTNAMPGEPQMNGDIAVPQPSKAPPLADRGDPRAIKGEGVLSKANEPLAMGHGGGRGEGRRVPQVQFAGGESNIEPSSLHHKMGGRGGANGTDSGAPRKSPYHYAGQGPSVPQFGDWNNKEAENYTLVFKELQDSRRGEGMVPGGINISPSPYNHTPNRTQQEKQPKCGFLSWLCT